MVQKKKIEMIETMESGTSAQDQKAKALQTRQSILESQIKNRFVYVPQTGQGNDTSRVVKKKEHQKLVN